MPAAHHNAAHNPLVGDGGWSLPPPGTRGPPRGTLRTLGGYPIHPFPPAVITEISGGETGAQVPRDAPLRQALNPRSLEAPLPEPRRAAPGAPALTAEQQQPELAPRQAPSRSSVSRRDQRGSRVLGLSPPPSLLASPVPPAAGPRRATELQHPTGTAAPLQLVPCRPPARGDPPPLSGQLSPSAQAVHTIRHLPGGYWQGILPGVIPPARASPGVRPTFTW